MADPSQITPKRKRGEAPSFAPSTFSFQLSPASSQQDGNSSPRSTIALEFRGLALGGGGGEAAGDPEDVDMEANGSTKKHHKPDNLMYVLQSPPQLRLELETAGLPDTDDKTAPQPDFPALLSEGSLQKAHPSMNYLLEPKSRRKRAGTPPLRPCPKKGQPHEGLSDADDEAEIVDPVRAALTWHEDEITIYDPDDQDDDGTGINGIGFKPTPALAQRRVVKRRQQMAEYRKREESEARIRRSQRRRGEAAILARRDNKSPPPSRRVRFIDADRRNIALASV